MESTITDRLRTFSTKEEFEEKILELEQSLEDRSRATLELLKDNCRLITSGFGKNDEDIDSVKRQLSNRFKEFDDRLEKILSKEGIGGKMFELEQSFESRTSELLTILKDHCSVQTVKVGKNGDDINSVKLQLSESFIELNDRLNELYDNNLIRLFRKRR